MTPGPRPRIHDPDIDRRRPGVRIDRLWPQRRGMVVADIRSHRNRRIGRLDLVDFIPVKTYVDYDLIW